MFNFGAKRDPAAEEEKGKPPDQPTEDSHLVVDARQSRRSSFHSGTAVEFKENVTGDRVMAASEVLFECAPK